MKSIVVEQNLLATHICNNPDFEVACTTGNCTLIMSIVEKEMKTHNLFTKGSNKLKEDIYKLTRGQPKVSGSVGTNILYFVWNSRMSGTGFGVV
jgi:hypothetical protein